MRSQAARVLANQFAKGFTAPVHQAFVALIGSADVNLDERCRVAEMLVPTMYAGAQGVDPSQMADALGALAKAVMAAERKEAEDYQEAMVGGSGGFSSGDGGRSYSGRFGRDDGGGSGGRWTPCRTRARTSSGAVLSTASWPCTRR